MVTKALKAAIHSPVGPIINLPRRALVASGYLVPRVVRAARWMWGSREDTNFTYELTDLSLRYLCSAISIVTGVKAHVARTYIEELERDEALRRSIRQAIESSRFRYVSDSAVRYGKRAGWYAITRILKPAVVVETGIDKGLGACVLASALLRNADEGHPGRYYGTDINPAAGWMLDERLRQVAQILVGDSIESLRRLGANIDLFINDSDHSAEYEYQEYATVRDKLSSGAVLLGDNAHVTNMLELFAEESDRSFLYFNEQPRDHWYPGGGIGFAFRG